jgi:four helix bundle protein
VAFLFEKLDVYQRALKWVETAEDISGRLGNKVSYSLRNQLLRASTSIPLNIAEGNGRWHKPDRKQFFWVARGSVFECLPIIQVFHRRSLIDLKTYEDCYQQLDTMAKMTTKLVQSVDHLNRPVSVPV